MSSQWQIESVLSRIQAIRTEIQRVAAKDHPYAEPGLIYHALLSVLDRSEKKVKQALELFPNNPTLGRRASAITLDSEDRALLGVAYIFNLADRVDSPRIPFEIIRALSWAAEFLLSVPCHTIIRLDTVYTYSISSCRKEFDKNDWVRVWEETQERLGTGGHPVLLLGFPSTSAGSALLHALAAHEFAHILESERQELIAKQLESLALVHTTRLCESYDDALNSYAMDTAVRQPGITQSETLRLRRAQVEASIKATTRSWFSEVFCDLVASKMVGPAFLAAVDRLTPTSADSPSRSHPPISVRRALVKQYLEKQIPTLVAEKIWNGVLNVASPQSAVQLPWIICREALVAGAEEITGVVNEVGVTSPFTNVGNLQSFLDNTDASFLGLSPPSVAIDIQGTHEDINYFWLLMFAAWRFRLTPKKFNKFRTDHNWSEAKAEEALSNLLLYSLQSLELRSRWRSSLIKNKKANGFKLRTASTTTEGR